MQGMLITYWSWATRFEFSTCRQENYHEGGWPMDNSTSDPGVSIASCMNDVYAEVSFVVCLQSQHTRDPACMVSATSGTRCCLYIVFSLQVAIVHTVSTSMCTFSDTSNYSLPVCWLSAPILFLDVCCVLCMWHAISRLSASISIHNQGIYIA